LRTSGARFAATRWSVVLAAADHQAGAASRRALEELIRAYWFPLYAFIRRQGNGPQQAEDLTQGFFAHLLEKEGLTTVDRSKGKFRSFLLAAMKNFLSKERARDRALKRGGGRAVIALDALDAEARYAIEPADEMTPERLFDRQWALAVLGQVLARLSAEYAQSGKARLCEAIEPCLTSGAGAINYAQVSREMRMTEGAIRVADGQELVVHGRGQGVQREDRDDLSGACRRDFLRRRPHHLHDARQAPAGQGVLGRRQ